MAAHAETQSAPALLRLPEVIRRTGYKKSTLYHLASQGKFPSPIPLGARAVAWNEHSVSEWINERIAMARKAA